MVFIEALKVVEQFRMRFPQLNFFDPAHQDIKHNFDEMMGRTVQRVALQTSERRDSHLGILATTSNIAPFMGLLGTVIGIINAFVSIGASGSADLATVAPAISEALVATGLGLFVAIPSSAAYNLFQFRTQLLSQKFDRFAVIMQHRIQQQFMDPARS
jgi:biopolymer transport protein TolQ